MRSVPLATPITLTTEERAVLEALARSTKSEVRMRERAWIVLLAADGVATREIGRRVGCTTGTASKWRVRYARSSNGAGRDREPRCRAQIRPCASKAHPGNARSS